VTGGRARSGPVPPVLHERMICGLQPVREAIRAHGPKLARILIESDAREGASMAALVRFAIDHGAPVERVSRADLDRFARGVRHQGAIAFARELDVTPLDDLVLGERALVIALDEVQDPQNFGAVIRSCVAMGATAIVWPEHRSAPLSAATFRASAGAVEHATLCRVPALPLALERLRARGLAVVGLDAGGELTLDRVNLASAAVLVVGGEGKGLRRTVKNTCNVLARVPMPGPIASLNASATVAMALYEAVRQRANAPKLG
jgi:23S rRNA (guanosine2251-2'-O)-methyltransferase